MRSRDNTARRALPQQARSRATVEQIFQTSLKLLEECGVDAFNTNLLAERAGLSPRAIYRYFPNKWTILIALAERVRQHEREWIGDLSGLTTGDDWRETLRHAIFDYYDAAARETGYRALRAASELTPELREHDRQANLAVQKELSIGLRSLGAMADDIEIDALSCVVIETSNRVIDIALLSDQMVARQLLTVLHNMIGDLLSRYLK